MFQTFWSACQLDLSDGFFHSTSHIPPPHLPTSTSHSLSFGPCREFFSQPPNQSASTEYLTPCHLIFKSNWANSLLFLPGYDFIISNLHPPSFLFQYPTPFPLTLLSLLALLSLHHGSSKEHGSPQQTLYYPRRPGHSHSPSLAFARPI